MCKSLSRRRRNERMQILYTFNHQEKNLPRLAFLDRHIMIYTNNKDRKEISQIDTLLTAHSDGFFPFINEVFYDYLELTVCSHSACVYCPRFHERQLCLDHLLNVLLPNDFLSGAILIDELKYLSRFL